MNPSITRRIGATAVEVPILGLGGSTLGGFRAVRPMSDEDAAATYESAWRRGVRYFDTAPRYGAGLGERRLGRALSGGRRDTCHISTKTGITADVAPARGGAWGIRCDYGFDATLRSIDESLNRLATDRLDLVFIHDIGAETHGEAHREQRFGEAMTGALPALRRLRDEAVVRAIGVGVASIDACERTLAAADIDVLMLAARYTLLDQSALDGLLPLCLQRGISVIAAAPFNAGIGASGPRQGASVSEGMDTAGALARARTAARICDRHGVPLGAVALQFPLAHPAVASVVAGSRTPVQAEATVTWLAQAVPSACWEALRAAGVIRDNAPVPDG